MFRAVARDGGLEVALSALRDGPLAKAERERDRIRVWPGLGSSPEPVPRLVQFPLPGEPFGVLKGAGRGVVAVRRGGLRRVLSCKHLFVVAFRPRKRCFTRGEVGRA